MIEDGKYNFTEDRDRVAEILRHVGEKWSVLIVVLLEPGPRRFNDLKRSIPGISQRMLTLTLRSLERDGLVERTVMLRIPPHVSYGLTEVGRSLRVPVRGLCEWAQESVAVIDIARKRFEKIDAA